MFRYATTEIYFSCILMFYSGLQQITHFWEIIWNLNLCRFLFIYRLPYSKKSLNNSHRCVQYREINQIITKENKGIDAGRIKANSKNLGIL